MEFGKGVKAEAAAQNLRPCIVVSITKDVEQITNLGSSVGIEVVDIDVAASKEEVEEALNKAVKPISGNLKERGTTKAIRLTG